MGDMADWDLDNGISAQIDHNKGKCWGGCPYCEEERMTIEEKKLKGKICSECGGRGYVLRYSYKPTNFSSMSASYKPCPLCRKEYKEEKR